MFRSASFIQKLGVIPVLMASAAFAQPQAGATNQTSEEQRTARAMLAAEQAGPLQLHAFLEEMPKGPICIGT